MISHNFKIRVRYAETDQMSYVYYGNYAQYFEMGRVEWLRNLGISYKSMEKDGIMLPVLKMEVDYFKPAKYDDLLNLKTTLLKIPSAKIDFRFDITNEENELLTTGFVTLVFVDMKKNKPIRAPKFILDKINASIK